MTSLIDAFDKMQASSAPLTVDSTRVYRNSMLRFTKLVGISTVKGLATLQPKTLQAKLDALRTDPRWKPASVKQALVVAAKLTRWLNREGVLSNNPFANLERFKVGNNVPEWNVLKPGELERVIEVLRAEGNVQGMLTFLLLGRHGLRSKKEFCALNWGDLDGDVLKFIGKGGKEARIRLAPEVAKLVAAVRPVNWKADRPLLVDADDSRVTYNWVYHFVCTVTQRIAGHRVTPHGLRATYISSAIHRKGIEGARKLARHSSLNTTQRYSRWDVLDDVIEEDA